MPYPSYTDPDEEIVDSIGASRGLPDTAFYSPDGEAAVSSNRAPTTTKTSSGPTSSATRSAGPNPSRADNRIMSAYLVVALIGIGLLLAELLLPTGGFLAFLGAVGLVVGGILARRPPTPARPSLTSPGPP